MYRKQSKGWTKHLDFIILDLVSLFIAYFLAYFIRHRQMVPFWNRQYGNLLFMFFIIQIMVSVSCESFKNVLKRGRYWEFAETFRHVFLVILCATFYLFVMKEGAQYSRVIILLTAGFYLAGSYVVRNLWKQYLLRHGLFDTRNSSLLILTSEKMMDSIVENMKSNNYERYHIAGIALLDADLAGTETGGYKIVAGRDTLFEYLSQEWVDEVLINLSKEIPFPDEIINQMIEMGVTVHVTLIRAAELHGQKKSVERLGSYTVLTTSINMTTQKQAICKRILDICGGLVGCLGTLVLGLIVGPIIYIQSPGPILFSQVRVGRNGKKFRIYKFRSMYMDAEERKKELMTQNRVKDGMMFKMDHDPRIIGGDKGIGCFIRKYSIDEFPQFWNVLKGDMSLVGTRPPTVDEWEKYDLHHHVRLAIKPGITGMWQVSGRSEIMDFEEVVRLDREYITNWSVGLDIKILFKTVQVVLMKKGAV